jgi:hypothetical protein
VLVHAAVLVFALAPDPARPGVALQADPCLELDDALLHETVELQLGAGLDLHAGPGSPGETRVLLGCGGDGSAEITVIDPLSATTLTRIVELPGPAERSEQLGKRAATLVRAAWLNLALERPPARSRARSTAARVARRPAAPWELGDGFVVRSYLGQDSPRWMLGEQVEVVHRPLRHLAWKADGELAFWRVPVEVDGVTDEVRTLSISAAPALLGWGEIPSNARRGAGTVALYGGAGFRAGGVRMRSEAFGDSSGFRSYAGPLATVRASVSLGRFVGLAVNLEAGWLIHGPARPSGVPLSLRGPWTNGVIVIVSRF